MKITRTSPSRTKSKSEQDRAAKQAEALRANIQKRKTQQRGRTTDSQAPNDTPKSTEA